MILFLSLLLAYEVTQLSKINVIDAAKNKLFRLPPQCIKHAVYVIATHMQMRKGELSSENWPKLVVQCTWHTNAIVLHKVQFSRSSFAGYFARTISMKMPKCSKLSTANSSSQTTCFRKYWDAAVSRTFLLDQLLSRHGGIFCISSSAILV